MACANVLSLFGDSHVEDSHCAVWGKSATPEWPGFLGPAIGFRSLGIKAAGHEEVGWGRSWRFLGSGLTRHNFLGGIPEGRRGVPSMFFPFEAFHFTGRSSSSGLGP